MEEINTFGLWVRQRRRGLDLTQQELARRVGCSVVTIRKIEAEERRPSRQIAELLAESLEISPEDRPRFLKFARTGYSAEPVLQPLPGTPPFREDVTPATAQRQESSAPAPKPVARGLYLPARHTPFIGREHELREIGRLLESPDCRLLTLIGPAGIGKTSLALQAAHEFAKRKPSPFPDGVFFIPFASTDNPAYILSALADGIGLAFHTSGDPKTQLLSYLEKKSLLLILDNLEHLLGVAQRGGEASGDEFELLVEILQSAPGVKQMVTSRERLNLRGEWLLDIHALPFPEEGQAGSIEGFSSVALFLQTARRVVPGFILGEEDRPWVARICQLVEGIPLGIEMAASWVRALSCREIAQEIERSLDFLATSFRDVPERHRSMRAAFDYSWRLLSEEERRIFRGLSVFRGTFTREAASRVADASLHTLSALVDKSLLRHTESGQYVFHELLKQYVAAKLDEVPEERSRSLEMHSTYFMSYLGEQGGPLRSSLQPEVLQAISAEMDDVRQAWQYAAEQRNWPAIRKAARPFCYYFELSGLMKEGAEIFDAAASAFPAQVQPGSEEAAAIGLATACRGFFRFRLGRYSEAKKLLEQARELLNAPETAVEYGEALTFFGILQEQLGEYDRACELLTEGIEHGARTGDRWNSALCRLVLGTVDLRRGRYPEAEKNLRQTLDLVREGGDPHITLWALQALSDVCSAQGDFSAAQDLLRESLRVSYDLKDRWGTATAQRSLGQVLFQMSQFHQAKYHLQDSLELYEEIGDRWGQAQTLNLLGDTGCALDEYGEARAFYRAALRNAVELQTLPLALDTLLRLGSEALRSGDEERAYELLAHVLHHPATRQETRVQAAGLVARFETRPGLSAEGVPVPPPGRLDSLIREIESEA